MNVSKLWSIKSTLALGMAVAMLGTTVGCTVVGPGYGNDSIYRGDSNYGNANFDRVSRQLRQDLNRKGYQVLDIKPDNYRGNRSIIAYAKKNNQAYELKYTYPDLKLINSSKKGSSNIWQDDKRQKDKGNYKKDKYNNQGRYKNKDRYKNDNVEKRIQKEARYPAIKQQAVAKVISMGYLVKDIKLEEKNNRGVFEIEAKRGSQDYEIVLSYPNLNVIKVEKD